MSPDPVRHADTIIFPASLDPQAVSVVSRLREAGYESYLVGGCVRDLLLGHIPKDFDASTEARPRQIRRVFRNCRVIGRRFKLAHVHFGSHIIEVATFRKNPTESGEPPDSELGDDSNEGASEAAAHEESGDTTTAGDLDADDLLITRDNVYGTAEEDTLRRDFTINALLYDVLTDEVIDYVGGVQDVEDKILRTIGDPVIRIAEDPVRMLRAVKFTARLGLTMDPALDAAMHASADQIDRSAPPRVLEEIYKMLTCGAASRALEMLLGYGLLERLLPELAAHWTERPEECLRLGAALDHVDQAQRSVGNSFVLALLFHDVWRAELERAENMDPLLAARNLIGPAALRMNIPRRDVSAATQMLLNQSRLERSRRGRRFRMKDFLERDTTVEALDLLYVRCLAGLADPECHARWALRMAQHHGSDQVPGTPDARRGGDSERARSQGKRRRRGGRRQSSSRNRGGQTDAEGSHATAGRKPNSGRNRSGHRGSATSPHTKAAGSATPSPDSGRPAPPKTPAAAPDAAAASADRASPVSGIANRIKGLFRRVLGRTQSESTPSSSAAGGNSGQVDAARQNPHGRSDAQDGGRQQSGTGAKTETTSRTSRNRRGRRGRRAGGGRNGRPSSAGGSESGSESGAKSGESSGGNSDGSDESKQRPRRRRSNRGGSSQKTSSGSGRSNRNRGGPPASDGRGKSAQTKAVGPKGARKKSEDSEKDTSGRHPEDVEDIFDW